MQMLRGSRSERLDRLVNVVMVLGVLLIVLAAAAILANVFGILGRFRQQIFLFIFGALLAYLIIPVVNLLQRVLRKRSAAIASAYLLMFLGLIVFGVLLLNPFISQARSLINNLHSPAASSLQGVQTIRKNAKGIQTALILQQQLVSGGSPISVQTANQTQNQIAALQRRLNTLSTSAPPKGQMRIPPSYVTPIQTPINQLLSAYSAAMASPGTVDRQALSQAVADMKRAAGAADTSYRQAEGTPILLLDAQTWFDQHGITVDLHDKFGNALQQLDKQASSVLNNALGIALQAGNLLLNTVLILIISVYFVSDGSRFVGWCIHLAPARNRRRARYFVNHLDQILGTYLRTQILLAALAATVATVGAVIFGIPYAIVIFFSTFLLSLIPVIGPVILPFPPMAIALIFTPLPKPIYFLIWLLVGEQIATNVIGPRVQGHSVGIHPLEAMAAALVGFPIGGFVGAFFAVPIVSFLHVVVHAAIHSGRHEALDMEESPPEAARPVADPSTLGSTPAG